MFNSFAALTRQQIQQQQHSQHFSCSSVKSIRTEERDDCGGISRCCDVYQNVRFENNNNEHIVIIDGAVVEIDENSIRAVSVGRFSGWGIRHHSSVESNEKRRRKRRENHDDEKDDDENEE